MTENDAKKELWYVYQQLLGMIRKEGTTHYKSSVMALTDRLGARFQTRDGTGDKA